MKKEVKIGIGLVFLAFYVFLIMQFGKVFVYYDDFGYLSLSYGNTVPDVIGSNYTLSQLLSFMGKHYFYSNGRLFYLFLFSFLNMIGGLAAVQILSLIHISPREAGRQLSAEQRAGFTSVGVRPGGRCV